MLNVTPTGHQTLLMWRLALASGQQFLKQLPDSISAKSKRQALVRDGLIDEDKAAPDGSKRKLTRLTLSDKGWTFLTDRQLSVGKLQDAGPVLDGLLTVLHLYLAANGQVLSDLFAGQVAEDSAARSLTDAGRVQNVGQDATEPASMRHRIIAAYQELAEGSSARRVRLADLRQSVGDLERKVIDDTLREMVRDGDAVLAPIDNPSEINDADRHAAVVSPLGRQQHLLIIETHSSAASQQPNTHIQQDELTHA